MAKLIFEHKDLEKRTLPVSDILEERKVQVLEFIKDWDDELGDKILAENFYLDEGKEYRKKAIDEVLQKIGGIKEIGEFIPFNQLRGRLELIGTNGKANLYFTLSPENNPKVQQLNVWLNED